MPLHLPCPRPLVTRSAGTGEAAPSDTPPVLRVFPGWREHADAPQRPPTGAMIHSCSMPRGACVCAWPGFRWPDLRPASRQVAGIIWPICRCLKKSRPLSFTAAECRRDQVAGPKLHTNRDSQGRTNLACAKASGHLKSAFCSSTCELHVARIGLCKM